MRARRPIKRPVLVAGEGTSERNYGALLSALAHELRLPVAIRAERCGRGGGDFLKCAQETVQTIKIARRDGVQYTTRILMIDSDMRGQVPDRDAEASALCQANRIHTIWQDQNHEAFLLRHFEGCQTMKPTARHSLRELRKVYPQYEKGMPSMQLRRVIGVDSISRAATVEHALRKFLEEIGWPL